MFKRCLYCSFKYISKSGINNIIFTLIAKKADPSLDIELDVGEGVYGRDIH